MAPAAVLPADPYFLDTHAFVTVPNRVLTFAGFVFDDLHLRIAERLAWKVLGVRRVVNRLEISLGGE